MEGADLSKKMALRGDETGAGWPAKSIAENTNQGEPVRPGHLTRWQAVGESSGEGGEGLGHVEALKSYFKASTLILSMMGGFYTGT